MLENRNIFNSPGSILPLHPATCRALCEIGSAQSTGVEQAEMHDNARIVLNRKPIADRQFRLNWLWETILCAPIFLSPTDTVCKRHLKWFAM